MDTYDLTRLDRLWAPVYPYLAAYIMTEYKRDFGDVLELGPFAGGISRELAGSYPGLKITIAAESGGVVTYLKELISSAGLARNIPVKETGLDQLVFNNDSFDLIIFRGAFFLLPVKVSLLGEMYRILRTGGLVFAGGGYGKGTSREIIDTLSRESRQLNEKLGRKRLSAAELEFS